MTLDNISKNQLCTSIVSESNGDRSSVAKQAQKIVLWSNKGYTMMSTMVADPLYHKLDWASEEWKSVLLYVLNQRQQDILGTVLLSFNTLSETLPMLGCVIPLASLCPLFICFICPIGLNQKDYWKHCKCCCTSQFL